jgi:alkylation response protein AidB-like acyl-CoA dehydrogenase
MSNVPAPDLHVLSDDALERLAAREATTGTGQADLAQPVAELSEAGYPLLAVPVELGGLGGNLVQVCYQQRRLARRAPALAVAVNEHLCWTGMAAELRRSGDLSLVWLLEEAAGGELFSGGIGVAGSLMALAWTQATLAAITTGIAERAFELGVSGARSAESPGRQDADRACRHDVALMAIELDALVAHAERVADDWSAGVAHGAAWPAKLAAARSRVADGAERIITAALGFWPAAEGGAIDELRRLRARVAAAGLAVDDSLEEIVGRWAMEAAS